MGVRVPPAGYALREAAPADRRRILVRTNPDRRPDPGAVLAEPGRELGAVTAAHDDRERAVIADHVTNATAVPRTRTERLTRQIP